MDEVDSVTLQAFKAFTSVVNKIQASKKGEVLSEEQTANTCLERKDYQWDDIIKWLVGAIFGLTILNVSSDFFRNYVITCYVPNDTSRDDVAYINNYCYSSLPRSEYFTLFIVIHGFLIIGPHVLWKTVFNSNFKFFFDLVSNLDRLRDTSTGEFTEKNFKIVTRLQSEFSRTIKIGPIKLSPIYTFYRIKLLSQLLSASGSIIFSLAFFDDFSEMFPCPSDSHSDGIISDDTKWPIPHSVFCVYPSIRFLSLLRYGDFFLVGSIIFILIYALFWTLLRHTTELGSHTVATFSAHSNLHKDSYFFPSFWKRPFSPGIKTDLDFLVLSLFRASSGQGMTFKDLQISQEMKRQYNRDSELLQLIVTHKWQMKICERTRAEGEIGVHRESDAKELYKRAGFRWDVKVGFHGSPRFEIESKNKPLLGLEDMQRPPNEIEIKATANALYEANSGIDQSEKYFDFFDTLFNTTHIQPIYPQQSQEQLDSRRRLHDINSSHYRQMLLQWSKKRGKVRLLMKVLNEKGHEDIADKLGKGEMQKNKITIKEEWSFQNRVYGFLQLVKPHRPNHDKRRLALDISFDGLGCSFILAWAFDTVCVLNFHSHYRTNEKRVKEDWLLNQVKIITLPIDYYSLPANQSDNLDDVLETTFFMTLPNPDERMSRRSGIDDLNDVYINFLTIGPITQDARRVTVNLALEKFHFGLDVAYNCLMLTIRPLKINNTDVRHLFLRYIPPLDLFKPIDECEEQIEAGAQVESKTIRTMSDLKEAIGEGSYCNVGVDEGLICYCGDVECVIEMELYRYIGQREKFEEK